MTSRVNAPAPWLRRYVRPRRPVHLTILAAPARSQITCPYLHGATRYFALMAVEFKNGGKMRWVVGWFGIHGGTVAWWQFPAVWPYL
jgi:hypothetical protein